MPVQDLLAPAFQGLREASQLGARVSIGAPLDDVVETAGRFVGVVGEVDVSRSFSFATQQSRTSPSGSPSRSARWSRSQPMSSRRSAPINNSLRTS